MREINEEDIKFLKNLQYEMNTQDTVCQADPRFWVVIETVRQWGYDPDYADHRCIVDLEGGIVGETVKECLKSLDENYDIKLDDLNITGDNIKDLDDLEYYLSKYTNGCHNFNIGYYKDIERIVPNTMFLTKRECEEHIKRNHYHYNKPHTYAMTAWRSPQVERLYEILHNVDWTIFNDDTNAYEKLPRATRTIVTLPIKGKLVVEKRKKRGIKLDEEVE